MTSDQKRLLKAAKDAAEKAHAPYSRFRVGAAVLTPEGIFNGANIENVSSNLGVCAERVALAHARMHGATTIIGIAICCCDAKPDATGSIPPNLTMPCGGCRQWLAELAPDAWIITNGADRVFTLQELLPSPFILK